MMNNKAVIPMTNVDELLIMISRKKHFSEMEQDEIRKRCVSMQDWNCFLSKAIETNLAPLVKRSFASIPNLTIPDDILKMLKQYQQKIIMHNMQLYNALERIGTELERKKIDFIPLKGMMLAEIVYGDISLRQMSDIDILVRAESVEACRSLLIDLGWNCKIMLSKSGEEGGAHWAHPYTFSNGPVTIELHRHIQNQSMTYAIDINEYWNRSARGTFLKGNAIFLSPEDLLQHLCVHAHKHLKGREIKISSFVDFSEVIGYYAASINWEQLRVNSIRYRCLLEVQGILAIAEKYWDANLPASFLVDYKKEDFELLEQLFLSRLDDPYSKRDLRGYNTRNLERKLKVNNGMRIRNFFEEFFPSRKFMIYRYKVKRDFMVYGYYPYRWYAGIAQIAKAGWWKMKGMIGKNE